MACRTQPCVSFCQARTLALAAARAELLTAQLAHQAVYLPTRRQHLRRQGAENERENRLQRFPMLTGVRIEKEHHRVCHDVLRLEGERHQIAKRHPGLEA